MGVVMNRIHFSSPQQAGDPEAPPIARMRFILLSAFFFLWIAAIGGRLVWLQVFRHHDFIERAARQQQRTFEVAPRRGVLYDRNLHELAMTVLVDSIYAVPSEIEDKTAVAHALAKLVHTDATDGFTAPTQINARFNVSRNFAWVARKQDPLIVEKVKALGLKGVYFQKEFKRFYPNNQIASQVLGYVSLDDNGLGGVEKEFDESLHGTPGHMLTALDAKRHVLGSAEQEPLPGENLVLTIDENIQFMAERALDAAMERVKAVNGTVVVQDPHTGQILALAIRPTYNANDFRHANTELLRNHAVSDVYEPGSTFKLVTYSAALEEKVAKPDDMIDCQGGAITIFGRTIHDAPGEHYGSIPVEKALWVSSDVAAVKLAMRMGSNKFYEYIRGYGFGSRSGVELPAETRGLLRPVRRWGATSIGSVAIGQEVGVTPVQLVTMVSTIANGGIYLPPHILLQSTPAMKGSADLKPAAYRANAPLPSPLPVDAHRVISTLTAAQMRKMMEGIVLFGTGKVAQLNGYSAGGKTGTAQKIDIATHTYSKTKYVASFAGIAPVNNPVISVAVIIDSPSAGGSHYGAAVSAPVFRDVAQQVLEYLGVPHDSELKATNDGKVGKSGPGSDIKSGHRLENKSDPKPGDDAPAEHTGDLGALFTAVNDLPADDPLRALPREQLPGVNVAAVPDAAGVDAALPASDPPPPQLVSPEVAELIAPIPTQLPQALYKLIHAAPDPHNAIVVDSGHKVTVPSFVGEPVRKVVEQAGTAGLGVQLVGSGTAREQAPAPGTLVPVGTQVVIRFSR